MNRNDNEISARMINTWIMKPTHNIEKKLKKYLCANKTKFCQARVCHVENHFGLICETIGSITRKNARLRDKGDILANRLQKYAAAECLNTTTRNALNSMAENYSTIQDYKQAEVDRLTAKVLKPIMYYGSECKQMKETIKREVSILKKERQTKQKLDKVILKNPNDQSQITRAETDAQLASQDASLKSQDLENRMEQFESKKVHDLKNVLKEFVTIEMTFHARALENLSKCLENISTIDEYADVEEFKLAMMDTTGTSRHLAGLGTLSSLGTTDTFGSTTLPTMTMTPSTPDRKQTVRISSPMVGYDDEDEEDDEEEDEEENYNQTMTSLTPRVRYA